MMVLPRKVALPLSPGEKDDATCCAQRKQDASMYDAQDHNIRYGSGEAACLAVGLALEGYSFSTHLHTRLVFLAPSSTRLPGCQV